MEHDEIKFLREQVQKLTKENQELKDAVDDFCTAEFSEEYIKNRQHAEARIQACWLKFCLSQKTREALDPTGNMSGDV